MFSAHPVMVTLSVALGVVDGVCAIGEMGHRTASAPSPISAARVVFMPILLREENAGLCVCLILQ